MLREVLYISSARSPEKTYPVPEQKVGYTLSGYSSGEMYHLLSLFLCGDSPRRRYPVKYFHFGGRLGFRSLWMRYSVLTNKFKFKSVSHTFMMTHQRCDSFCLPLNQVAGSTLHLFPHFTNCQQAKLNAASWYPLSSSHACSSNQLMLKLLC